MFGLYKRSMDEAAGLSALLTMVLLHDEVYKAEREALIQFAKVDFGKKCRGASRRGPRPHVRSCL